MNQALLNSLTEAERSFVEETSTAALGLLDEDGVLELHTRARRMRDKYVKNYRRTARSSVPSAGGRGRSWEAMQRHRGKAEVFETALARVSRRLGSLAAQSAAELRRERIHTARAGSPGPDQAAATPPPVRHVATRPRGAVKTTGGVKKDASTRAMGARRQAARDNR